MRRILVILVITIINNWLFCEDSGIDLAKYRLIIDHIMTDLDNTISNGNAQKDVDDAYSISKKALQEKAINYIIDPTISGVLDGMSFAHNLENDKIDFCFTKSFLDSYSSKCSIYLAIIIHEMRHARDYLINKDEFIAAQNDPKEMFWFELDAMHVEAEFIKNYSNIKSLSKFEQFLLDSYQKDNLDSAALFMHFYSEKTFFYLLSLEDDYSSSKVDKDSVINSIISETNKLIDLYSSNLQNNEYTKYIIYIKMRTFQKFMLRTTAIAINQPKMTWKEVFDIYPGLGNNYNALTDLIKKETVSQNAYIDKIRNIWEEDIKKKSI